MQGYSLERVVQCILSERCKQLAIHHRIHVSCWRWSYYMKMQETTNHCIDNDERWSIWPGVIVQMKRFGVGNFWQIWDTCMKD